MLRLSAIVITVWAGSLWTICILAAPILFATLERQDAGQVAAKLFHIEAWLGLALAAVLVAAMATRRGLAARIGPLWLIALTALAPMASRLVLSPIMDAARAANDMKSFGLAHSVSAALFFGACLGALALVWRFNRPAE